jgi:cellulose synthase/poly-beta-1,6-N-acetylglucosamine synthase-like glycosyltransferase
MTAALTLAAVIAAHDEAAVIAATLASLLSADPPPQRIIVIADHCTDATAELARQAGAVVLERDEGEGSKGAALRWLFAQHAEVLAPFSHTVIFDADTTVQADFFAHLSRSLASGADAAQSFVQPIGYEHSTATTLAAYSEVLSQVADDRLRAWLRWPAPLRGTGMAFRAELLRELLPQMRTQTEDVELALLLAERRARVSFVEKAVLFDPKPPDAGRVSRQRARWLSGLAQVWRDYAPRIARLLLRGPAIWFLLQAVLLKPATLFAVLKVMALLIALLLPLSLGWRVAALAWLGVDGLYYGLGLLLVPQAQRGRFARALLLAPLYLGVWAGSLITALRHRGGWLSVRR